MLEFNTDIFELKLNSSDTFNLIGAKLPDTKDLFFRAKQEEIYQQYESARIFLRETERNDLKYWFNEVDPKHKDIAKLLIKERMFESALMFYNIVVDLSWVLCYVSAEYAYYQGDVKTYIKDMKGIEESYKLLREIEADVTNPTANGNPFEYLKHMSLEFRDSIDLVMDFWKYFRETEIRNLYNYIKHRGKPLYEEIDRYNKYVAPQLYINNVRHSMDKRDVQKVVSLEEYINKLKEFDDNKLFPYIEGLYEKLELAIKPTPFKL